MDQEIKRETLDVERKGFTFQWCKNERGQFLRITEECNGRRNSVVVPSSGVEGFVQKIGDVTVAARPWICPRCKREVSAALQNCPHAGCKQ